MVKRVAAALQVSGAAALMVAAWDVAWSLGVAVAGVALLVFGVAVERGGDG